MIGSPRPPLSIASLGGESRFSHNASIAAQNAKPHPASINHGKRRIIEIRMNWQATRPPIDTTYDP
jgi:hypothetical protein